MPVVEVERFRPDGVEVTEIPGAPFGCRVAGFDVKRLQDNPELIQWAHDMLHANKVIVFKGQKLLPLEFAAYSRNFAKRGDFDVKLYTGSSLAGPDKKGKNPLGNEIAAPWRGQGVPNMMILSNIETGSLGSGVLRWEGEDYNKYKLDFSFNKTTYDATSRRAGVMNGAAHWHTDMTFDHEPGTNTMMYCKQTPDQARGGRTSFCDTAAAYRDLPEEMRVAADAAICAHADTPGKGLIQVDGDLKLNQKEQTRSGMFNEPVSTTVRWNTKDGLPRKDQMNDAYTYHPLIRPHPVTGERAIYSPCGSNCGVVGWTSEESFDFLGKLTSHCLQPKYRFDCEYQKDDLVHWDVSTTMHRANALPSATCDEDTRLMLRISNQGVNPDIPNAYTKGIHFEVPKPDAAGSPPPARL